MKALLVLEDGRFFPCRSFTGGGEASGEIVFNTSMTGYQEILTDPSYYGQMLVMTYPMIGNCGINISDIESYFIYASAFLIKEYQSYPSNFRSVANLANYLKWHGIIGVDRLDTRALTKHIRQFGSMRGFLSTFDLDPYSMTARARAIPKICDLDLVSKVTTTRAYRWNNSGVEILDEKIINHSIWRFSGRKSSVVVFDYGLKFSLLRYLMFYDFEIVVVPSSTSASTVKALAPDGVFLSNGPGDPSMLIAAIETVRNLITKEIPIFGVCLGHQILSLALGASAYKLKFGHRGCNHPVKNLLTNKIEITVQNHGFAIDTESLIDSNVEITHVNLNDNTIEGIRHRKLPIFSVQYHPEGSPGPKDATYLFEQFKSIVDDF